MKRKAKTPRKSSVEMLVEKLRANNIRVGEPYVFVRHYPGHWERSSGAWVWSLQFDGDEIGSDETVKSLLRASGLRKNEVNNVDGFV